LSQDPSGFYGPHLGWIDASGNEISIADFAAMDTDAAMSMLGDPGTSTKLDPNSSFADMLGAARFGLGMAVPGPFSLVGTLGEGVNLATGRPSGITSFLSGVSDVVGDFGLGEISFNPFGPETSQQISDAAESVAEPFTGAVEQAGQAISDAWSGPFAQSLGFHSEPSQFSVTPTNRGPGIQPPQVPSLATQPLEPLSAVEVADYTDGGHTVEQLMEMGGVGYIDPELVTSIFAHGGFVDKPLYSRS
jgi:hypothetical protein